VLLNKFARVTHFTPLFCSALVFSHTALHYLSTASNGNDERGEGLDEEGATEEKDEDREKDRDRDREQARSEEGSGIAVLRRIARLASAFLKVTDPRSCTPTLPCYATLRYPVSYFILSCPVLSYPILP
jgi:hypothetical protein